MPVRLRSVTPLRLTYILVYSADLQLYTVLLPVKVSAIITQEAQAEARQSKPSPTLAFDGRILDVS